MPWWFVSIVASILAAITQPNRVECPNGWYISLRSDRGQGSLECREVVPPDAHEPRGHEQELEVVGYDGVIKSVIYCSDGWSPIVIGSQAATCQPNR